MSKILTVEHKKQDLRFIVEIVCILYKTLVEITLHWNQNNNPWSGVIFEISTFILYSEDHIHNFFPKSLLVNFLPLRTRNAPSYCATLKKLCRKSPSKSKQEACIVVVFSHILLLKPKDIWLGSNGSSVIQLRPTTMRLTCFFTWLSSQAESFYEKDNQKLVAHYNRCCNISGRLLV